MTFSTVKVCIFEIMKENGFIVYFDIVDKGNNKKEIVVTLKYGKNRERVIYGLKRISKGGRREYVAVDKIPSVQGGLGVAVLSTSKGIISDKRARQENVGGEVMCHIW